jgi:dipeptidyl aminopeptidase/acylaminoacyl peptidase
MGRIAFVIIPLLLPYSTAAQSFQLTVENIMRGPDLVGTAPTNVQFSADGRFVYFRWRAPARAPTSLADTLDQDYRVNVVGAPKLERLPRNAIDTIPLANGVWSPDRRRELIIVKGDIWVVERTGAKRRLTQTTGAEASPAWSQDGRTVYFTREGNAWALDLTGGSLVQLTDIRPGTAPRKPAEAAGQARELRDEQQALFDFVRRQVADERLRADTDTVHTVKPVYVGERRSATDFEVAPDGRYVLVTVTERARGDSSEGRRVTMPVWVTQSGYVETQQIRTKVGDAQPRQTAALIEVATGKVTWIARDTAIEKRPTDAQAVGFSQSGRHALVRITSRDYEDAWLVVVDVPSLARRDVAQLHDDAWLDGPLSGVVGWIPGGANETIYYGSEQTGYAHLYTVPAAGGAASALTSGSWEVQQVTPAPDGRSFYVHTNEGDFGQVHFYTLDRASGRRTRLTSAEGRQDAVVSPDGKTLAVLHSTANRPPELFFQDARAGATPRKVTESTTPEFRSFDWIVPEIVMIPADSGVEVPARLYRPRGAASNGAAVIFVHGAGYLQNVHKWWSSYFREYMFHHLLAARGFTVLDLDYGGSAGHGRNWRTAIYRHMGGLDLADQLAGARWLVSTQHVDSSRIGIYGGSYGGFITLMAMFTRPGVFAAGAALRPVTDWAHYNHPYTARILNEPHSDTVAYRRSSPIYFAEGLRGRLLICHGMVDDNVHFQDTARLIQRLIELGKDNWEAAMYPVEPHAFRRADSWTDEYRRILRLFEQTIGTRN